MTEHEVFEAGSLEAALQLAAERFGKGADDLRFVVLREDRGFLGVGSRGVSVRVEVPGAAATTTRATPAERRRKPVEVAPRPAAAAVERLVTTEPADSEEDDEREELAPSGPDPTAVRVGELAAEIVRAAKFDLTTAMAEQDDRIVVELSGPDRELLLERRGETLNALQYLLNRMARKSLGTVKRIQLESEGYRSDRDEEIRLLAMEASDRVLRSGEPYRLPPLNPYERRIVHVTISRRAGVSSESEGDGFIKRVTVRPTAGGRGGRARGDAPRTRRPRRG